MNKKDVQKKNIFARMAMALVTLFSVSAHRDNIGAYRQRGRDGFYGVSAGRTHAVKRRHPL